MNEVTEMIVLWAVTLTVIGLYLAGVIGGMLLVFTPGWSVFGIFLFVISSFTTTIVSELVMEIYLSVRYNTRLNT